jgi:hypothetical protein
MIFKVEERLSETTRIRASSRQGASDLDDIELDAVVLDFLQTVRRQPILTTPPPPSALEIAPEPLPSPPSPTPLHPFLPPPFLDPDLLQCFPSSYLS